MSQWIKACNVDDISEGSMFSFDHDKKRILVANMQGKFYASDLICTHADADLSLGFLTPQGVRCPLHLSVFDLNDGKPQNPPAVDALRIYNVKIKENEIYVEV